MLRTIAPLSSCNVQRGLRESQRFPSSAGPCLAGCHQAWEIENRILPSTDLCSH